MFRIPIKFRWIYRHLNSSELSRDCSFDLCLNDLFDDSKRRFMDYYSEQGLRLAIKRYGFVAKLRELGYEQIDLKFGVREDGSHFLEIFEPPYAENNRVAEFVARKIRHNDLYPVLKVEWLCLQNTRSKFADEKPRLPGQQFPGLGLGKDVLSVIMLMAIRLKFSAMINVADHFHNAFIYAASFYFEKPEAAASMLAMKRFMEEQKLSLAETAWALEEGRILDVTAGQPFGWEPAVQILPLRSALEDRYQQPEYQEAIQSALASIRFQLKES